MSTERSFTSSCPARAALAGNPSDAYGGAVVAVPIDELCAIASATGAERFRVQASDPDLLRLLTATADVFGESVGRIPDATLSASSTIPRSVGLAGSSAIVIAALRALGGWTDHRWGHLELAELALSVERDRLGTVAGLQDRLVQATRQSASMAFDPVTYELLDTDELPLFVAWSPDAAEPSDTVHRSLRRRHDAGDPDVTRAMRELAGQAVRATDAIHNGDLESLGAAMDTTFDLRASIVDVGDAQRRLVEIGRDLGAAVNSAGSGGSVVGLCRDDLTKLQVAYERTGAGFVVVN
jgi:glucuronokinase